MGKEKKPSKAENVAGFIVKNWHFCPVSEDVSVPNCCGWRCSRSPDEDDYRKCVNCIMKHSGELG